MDATVNHESAAASPAPLENGEIAARPVESRPASRPTTGGKGPSALSALARSTGEPTRRPVAQKTMGPSVEALLGKRPAQRAGKMPRASLDPEMAFIDAFMAHEEEVARNAPRSGSKAPAKEVGPARYPSPPPGARGADAPPAKAPRAAPPKRLRDTPAPATAPVAAPVAGATPLASGGPACGAGYPVVRTNAAPARDGAVLPASEPAVEMRVAVADVVPSAGSRKRRPSDDERPAKRPRVVEKAADKVADKVAEKAAPKEKAPKEKAPQEKVAENARKAAEKARKIADVVRAYADKHPLAAAQAQADMEKLANKPLKEKAPKEKADEEKKKKVSPDHAGALIATIVDASRAGHGKAAGEFVRAWAAAALRKTLGVVDPDGATIAAYLVLLLQFCAVVRRTATPEAAECARVLRLWLGLIAAGDDALRGAVLRVLPAANAPKKDEGKPKVAAAWMRVASATELAGDWAALVEELALYARAVQSGRVREEGRAVDDAKLAAAVAAAAAAVSATKPEMFARFIRKMGVVPKELREPSADTVGLLVWAAEWGAAGGREVAAAALAFGKCSDAAARPARDARGGVETWARIVAAANRGGHLKGDNASMLLRDAIAAIAARSGRIKVKGDKKGDKLKDVKGAKNGIKKAKVPAKADKKAEKKEKKSGTAKAAGAAKAKRA